MSEATLSSAPRSALVTGASKGMGLALARSLVADGWTVVVDARHGSALDEAVGALGPGVVAVLGALGDATHRRSLAARSEEHTSELQSLMGISFAASCVNKQQK